MRINFHGRPQLYPIAQEAIYNVGLFVTTKRTWCTVDLADTFDTHIGFSHSSILIHIRHCNTTSCHIITLQEPIDSFFFVVASAVHLMYLLTFVCHEF